MTPARSHMHPPKAPAYIDKALIGLSISQRILAYLALRQAPVHLHTLAGLVGIASTDLGGYLSPYLRRGAVVRCGPSTYVIGTVPAKKAAQLSAAIRPCADAPGGQAP